MAIIKPKLHTGAALASKKGTGGGYAPVKLPARPKPPKPPKPVTPTTVRPTTTRPGTLPKPVTPTAPKPVAPLAPKPAAGTAQKDAGFNPGGVPKPRQTPAAVAAVSAAPAGGGTHLKVLQKQADGKTYKYVEMDRSKMTADLLKRALADQVNAGRAGYTGKPVAAAPAPASTAAAAAPAAAAPTWTPPKIDLSGLTADPITGRIDWSSIINAANGIAGTDTDYSREISEALRQVQAETAGAEGELSSLVRIDPATGKTLAQTLLAQAANQFQQRNSSIFGNAAARGISSSGMTDQSITGSRVDNAQNESNIVSQYGSARIAELARQIQQSLSTQNTNFLNAYYSAVNRGQAAMPSIGG